MLRHAPSAPTHEDLFFERYDRLVVAAASLTGGDREAARELVHEAYVLFVVARPALDGIQQIDSYLFITLRNLHISSVRRQARVSHLVTIVDFDSPTLGLCTLSAAQRVQAADELRWICEYMRERRSTARAASAFLLHYFLGYRPSEVALVLRNSVAIVHKLLHLARVDVRMAQRRSAPTGRPSHAPAHVPDLSALRRAIVQTPPEPCSTMPNLALAYRGDAAVGTKLLAHIVGCRPCLDRVNALLGLPRLADRERDMGDTDEGPPDSSPGPRDLPRSRRADLRGSWDAVAAATHEHRPKELRIAVNGFTVGMQRVAGTRNEQVVRLGTQDLPIFVEVLTEQDVRLVLLNAEPLTASGAVRQTATVSLSDDRELELALDFSDLSPSVAVTYHDPLFWEIERADELTADRPAAVSTRAAQPRVAREWNVGPEPAARVSEHATGLRALWALWVRATSGWPASGLFTRRRLLQFAGAAIALWLLFAPATAASAAEGAFQAIVRVVGELRRWMSAPALAPIPHARPVTNQRLGDVSLPAPVQAVHPATAAVTVPGALDRTHAEMLALVRLQRAGAYLGQEVQVSTGAHGLPRFDVTVGEGSRRAALTAVLDPFVADQQIEARVATPEELNARARASAPARGLAPGASDEAANVRVVEFNRDRIEAAAVLFRHLGDEQAVRDFANDMLNRSRAASQHAWALHYLCARYEPALVKRLSRADRDLLMRLIDHHAREFERHVERLSTALQPMFGTIHAGAEGPSPVPADAWELARRLLELNRTRDAAIRRALVVGNTAGDRLDSAGFWDAMDRSRQMAQQVREHASLFQP